MNEFKDVNMQARYTSIIQYIFFTSTMKQVITVILISLDVGVVGVVQWEETSEYPGNSTWSDR